jgi:cytochrome c oxidase subunit I
MAAPFAKRANLTVAAFVVIALAVGLALFAIQVVLRLELMANGLQYICAPGGPEICYLDADFATAVSQVPMVFFVTLVLVPACLALLVLRPLKTLPPTAARWGVLAMWFAFACYLSVPLLGIYFSSSLSSVTSQTGWTLYPPLSSASLPAHLAGRPNALQMNSFTVAVLLILLLVASSLITLRQPHSTMSKVARTGGVAVLCGVIWVLFKLLSSLNRMVSLDRNFGTVFFDPAAKPQTGIMDQIVETVATPAVWCAALAVSFVILWILVRQITRSAPNTSQG